MKLLALSRTQTRVLRRMGRHKSSKQCFPALSTAESEMIEVTGSLTLADSFEALIQERKSRYEKTLFCDNSATIHLVTEPQGGWRTRHLRLRSQHVRWRLGNLDWRLRFCPGAIMVADIGTKALPRQRLFELMEREKIEKVSKKKEEVERGEVEALMKELQKLKEDLPEELCEETKKVRLESGEKLKNSKEVLQMLMIPSMMRGVTAQRDEGVPVGFYAFLLGYTVMVIAVTILCQMWWTREKSPRALQSEQQVTDSEQGPMTPQELLALAEEVRHQAQEALKSKESEVQKKRVLAAKTEERCKVKPTASSAAASSSMASETVDCACAAAVDEEEHSEVPTNVQKFSRSPDGGPSIIEEEHRLSVYVTALGEKYHMSRNCSFLANARRIARSDHCSTCVPVNWRPDDKIVNAGIDLPSRHAMEPWHQQK